MDARESGLTIFLGSEHSRSNWYHSNTPNSRHLFNRNMYFEYKYVLRIHSFILIVKKILKNELLHWKAYLS